MIHKTMMIGTGALLSLVCLAASQDSKSADTTAQPATAAADTATNRRVQPGLVTWHETHAAALAAAKKSGKPVLHFQLLGRLDEEFC
jgi:hypothetical protein